jgi:hypothetical protein
VQGTTALKCMPGAVGQVASPVHHAGAAHWQVAQDSMQQAGTAAAAAPCVAATILPLHGARVLQEDVLWLDVAVQEPNAVQVRNDREQRRPKHPRFWGDSSSKKQHRTNNAHVEVCLASALSITCLVICATWHKSF